MSVSPLGILIHPDWGLWHSYRGALAFRERLDLPASSLSFHLAQLAHARLVAQRRLTGGQDEDPIQPKLPPRGGGDGDMPFVGRIEGPSEDAEHGGHGWITPTVARSGNPKQA